MRLQMVHFYCPYTFPWSTFQELTHFVFRRGDTGVTLCGHLPSDYRISENLERRLRMIKATDISDSTPILPKFQSLFGHLHTDCRISENLERRLRMKATDISDSTPPILPKADASI